MRNSVKVPDFALKVAQTLQNAGHVAVCVGGSVRDSFLGKSAEDWDLATSAMPEEVMQLFQRVEPTGLQHGTVTVVVDGEPVEVTTFRSEGDYTDSRRPDAVMLGVSLEEDLARRDFTINAMAYDPVSKELFDPFGGEKDLLAGMIRTVGRAEDRFNEDGLRVMRAVRFMAVLNFQLDPDTKNAIPGALAKLQKVSVERVQVELFKMLKAQSPEAAFAVAKETGVLSVALPEGKCVSVGHLPCDPLLRLAAMVGNNEKAMRAAFRLKLSNTDRARLQAMFAVQEPQDAEEMRRQLSVHGLQAVSDFADLQSLPELKVFAQQQSKFPLRIKDLAVNGTDLQQEGLEGPQIGQALAWLLDLVLARPEANKRSLLLQKLNER